MIRSHRTLFVLGALGTTLGWFSATDASGQARPNTYDPVFPPNAPTTAPVIGPDRRVTFRVRAPDANAVKIAYLTPDTIPMLRGPDGTWAVTVGPLNPGRYAYLFKIDGLEVLDAANLEVLTDRVRPINVLDVPGEPPRANQRRDVPHGAVHIRSYHSAVLGMERPLYVYVPPQYDTEPSRRFPVLYLRHGNGGTEATWFVLNKLNWILDNMIAAGSAVPMIVVMPNGYPGPLGEGNGIENVDAVDRELMTDIVPHVDRHYRTLLDRENRGISGFSLGGVQAMHTGVKHVDHFAWIAEVSGGELSRVSFDPSVGFGEIWADPAAANAQIRLLYLACGTEDPRINGHLNLSETLTARGIKHHLFVAPGGHNTTFSNAALVDLLPRLFRPT